MAITPRNPTPVRLRKLLRLVEGACAINQGWTRVSACIVGYGACALGASILAPSRDVAATSSCVVAASSFLSGLRPELRAKASFAFDDRVRRDWHFIPKTRPGVTLGEMSQSERRAAHTLLMTALSSQGYLKLNAIMGLEKTLFDMERASGGSGATRDAERYAFAVFGKPGADADWGWRIEGHHVSLNFTVGERLCVTPSFLGANPAEVRSGPTAGLRVLAREEDLARALVQSMSDTQRPKAIIAPVAPPDILLQPGMDARAVQSDVGLPVAEMTPDQRDRTFELIAEYVASFKTGLGSWLDDIRASDPQALRFAWAGAIEPGKPHYYRISNAHFAIEYDNTQNDANHIHTVWRDFDHDFGDPLREHLREDHGARVAPR